MTARLGNGRYPSRHEKRKHWCRTVWRNPSSALFAKWAFRPFLFSMVTRSVSISRLKTRETGLVRNCIECDAPRHDLLQHARAREIWRPKRVGAGDSLGTSHYVKRLVRESPWKRLAACARHWHTRYMNPSGGQNERA